MGIIVHNEIAVRTEGHDIQNTRQETFFFFFIFWKRSLRTTPSRAEPNQNESLGWSWVPRPSPSQAQTAGETCWLPTVIHSALLPLELGSAGVVSQSKTGSCCQKNGGSSQIRQMSLILGPRQSVIYSPFLTQGASETPPLPHLQHPPWCLLGNSFFSIPREPSPTSHTQKRKWEGAFLGSEGGPP